MGRERCLLAGSSAPLRAMTAPDVTVAVVSWNTHDLLRDCLESLAADADRGRAAVWVVDNGSSDGSPDLVRETFPWARLVVPETNLGFGRAVNLVADQTSSPWIAPSNADVRLRPGALAALQAVGERHPGVGWVAPRLLLPDGTVQHSVFPFPSPVAAMAQQLGVPTLVRGFGDERCLPGFWDSSRPREVPWAVGAFILVRRTAWAAVRGFDERQWMYAEDLDLGWRLTRAGWRCRYEPSALVEHAESAATDQAFGGRKTLRWMMATYGWVAWRRGVLVAWTMAAIGVSGATLRWLLGSALRGLGRSNGETMKQRALFWMEMHRTGLRSRTALLAQGSAE